MDVANSLAIGAVMKGPIRIQDQSLVLVRARHRSLGTIQHLKCFFVVEGHLADRWAVLHPLLQK